VAEKDRLKNMSIGIVPDVPRNGGFRLPLRTVAEIVALGELLLADRDGTLKMKLVK
jgi:hypothetical protein